MSFDAQNVLIQRESILLFFLLLSMLLVPYLRHFAKSSITEFPSWEFSSFSFHSEIYVFWAHLYVLIGKALISLFLWCSVFPETFVEKNSLSALNGLITAKKSGLMLFYIYSFMPASYSFVGFFFFVKIRKNETQNSFCFFRWLRQLGLCWDYTSIYLGSSDKP